MESKKRPNPAGCALLGLPSQADWTRPTRPLLMTCRSGRGRLAERYLCTTRRRLDGCLWRSRFDSFDSHRARSVCMLRCDGSWPRGDAGSPNDAPLADLRCLWLPIKRSGARAPSQLRELLTGGPGNCYLTAERSLGLLTNQWSDGCGTVVLLISQVRVYAQVSVLGQFW